MGICKKYLFMILICYYIMYETDCFLEKAKDYLIKSDEFVIDAIQL